MPRDLSKLSVTGNSCVGVHSNASGESGHLLAWICLWSPGGLLLYDDIRDAKLIGKLEQQLIEKASEQ